MDWRKGIDEIRGIMLPRSGLVHLAMTALYQIPFSLWVCPSYLRPKSRKRSAQEKRLLEGWFF